MPSTKQIVAEYFPSVDFAALESDQINAIAKVLREDQKSFVVSCRKTYLTWIKRFLVLALIIIVGIFSTQVLHHGPTYPVAQDVPVIAAVDSESEPLVQEVLAFLQTQHLKAYDLAYYRHEGGLRPNVLSFKVKASLSVCKHVENFFESLDTHKWLPGTLDVVSDRNGHRYYTLRW